MMRCTMVGVSSLLQDRLDGQCLELGPDRVWMDQILVKLRVVIMERCWV